VRHGAIAANPVRDVARIPRKAKAPRALTDEEQRLLRKPLREDTVAVALDLPDLVDFMLGTGVRIGEACAVRYGAVDADTGLLQVTATVVRVRWRGLVIQESPKTDAGRRTIALPPFAIDMVNARRARLLYADDLDVVFRSPTGLLRDPNNTSGDLRAALDRARFDWVTSHVFRKTVATRLDEAGLSARQIADHLGHQRPSITQDVYMGRRGVTSAAAHVLDLDPSS